MSANKRSLFTAVNNVKSANQIPVEQIKQLLRSLQPHDVPTGVNTSNMSTYRNVLKRLKQSKNNQQMRAMSLVDAAESASKHKLRSSEDKKSISKSRALCLCTKRVRTLIRKVSDSLIKANNTPNWIQEAEKTLVRDRVRVVRHHLDALLLVQQKVSNGYRSLRMCVNDEKILTKHAKELTMTTNNRSNIYKRRMPIEKGTRVTNANGNLNAEVAYKVNANGEEYFVLVFNNGRINIRSLNNIQRMDNYTQNKNMSTFLNEAEARLKQSIV